MKNILFVLSILLLSLSASAQFRMVGTAGTWTSLGGGSYSTTVTFSADLTGNSYLPTAITTSFYLVTGSATANVLQEFTITSRTNLTFSSADLVVQQVSPTSSAPGGLVMVFDPASMGGFIPQVPFASAGATGQLQAAVDTYNAKKAALGFYDYITTDSFSTFVGGHSFASIPLNKTILRTTTGSIYQKTGTNSVTERTVGNGLLATTKLTQSGSTLTWNSNLNNRVGLNTGGNASVTITNPSNLTSQTFGETFVVQVSTSTIPVTVNFDTVYSKFDFTGFGSVTLASFTEATYSFRVIKSGNKGYKLACTDDVLNGTSIDSVTIRNDSILLIAGIDEFYTGKEVSPLITRFDAYTDQKKDSLTIRTVQEGFATTNATISELLYFDADTAQSISLYLTQNTSIATPINLRKGVKYTIYVQQDATGGRTLAFSDKFLFTDGTLGTNPYQRTIIDYEFDGEYCLTTMKKVVAPEEYAILMEYKDSIELAFLPHLAGAMYREVITSTPEPVTAIGQPVKVYDSNDRNGSRIVSIDGTQAVGSLEYTDGRYGVNFDRANNESMRITGSRYYPTANGQFSIYAEINPTSLPALTGILSNRITGIDVCFSLDVNASGTIRFLIFNGASTIAFHTTTATVTTTGWYRIIVRGNGTNGNIQINNTALETFTLTSPVSVPMTRDINLADLGDGTSNFDGQIGKVLIFNRYISDALILRLDNYQPQYLNFTSTYNVLPGTFTPNSIQGAQWFDFSDSTKVFSDLGKINNAGTNGEIIFVAANKGTGRIVKDAIAPASGNTAVVKTAARNGLQAATFSSADRYSLNMQTLLESREGNFTAMFVFATADTARNHVLLGDNSGKYIHVVSGSGGTQNSFWNQTVQFLPTDSLYKTFRHQFSTAIGVNQWKIVIVRRLGKNYEISNNGEQWERCTNCNFAGLQFTTLSHATSTISFIGDMGETIIYPYALDNQTVNKLLTYGGNKWAITTRTLNEDELDGYEQLVSTFPSNRDYNSFPSPRVKNDTLHTFYNVSTDHNSTFGGTTHGLYYQRFNDRNQKIGTEQQIFADQVSPNLWWNDGDFSWRNDTMIFTGTLYDVNNADTIWATWKYRYPNGTLGSNIRIIHPGGFGNSWFASDKIHFSNGYWYVWGYRRNGLGGKYTASLLKTNTPLITTSWTIVCQINGNGYTTGSYPVGGIDPEEVQMIQLESGEWIATVRDDAQSKIYQVRTWDINVWPNSGVNPPLTLIGHGIGKPKLFQSADKSLYVTTRKVSFAERIYSAPWVYKSTDRGKTWQTPYNPCRELTEQGATFNYGGVAEWSGLRKFVVTAMADARNQFCDLIAKNIE